MAIPRSILNSQCGALLLAIVLVSFAAIRVAQAQTPATPAVPTPPADTVPLVANGKPIAFDIVSFRPAKTYGSTKVDMPADGDYIAYKGIPIWRLLYFAYFAVSSKITGEPGWVDEELYDFQAKVAPEDIAAWQKMPLAAKRLMVRPVLAESLKLKLHENTTADPIYELIVDKGGPKLTEYKEGESKTFPDGQVMVGSNVHWTTPVDAYFQGVSMSSLAGSLSGPNRVGRIVIDKTGLTGKYNLTLSLQYAPLPPQMQDQFPVPNTFNSIQKYGLKLAPAKAVVPGIIIDHVERPPDN